MKREMFVIVTLGFCISLILPANGIAGDYPDSVVATIPVGNNPCGIAATPGGNYIWVSNMDDHNVSIIRASDYTVVDTISTGEHPYGIAFTPDGSYAYIMCYNNSVDNVYVVRTSDNTVVNTISVGYCPCFAAVLPNSGDYVYVSVIGDDNVSVIRTSDNTVVTTIPVGNAPNGLDITPDGNYVYVPNNHGSSVSVIRTSDNTVVSTIPVGNEPTVLTVTPSSEYVYVAHWRDNVFVIRTSDDTVVDEISIPHERDRSHGVAFTPDGSYAYVTSAGKGNVYVIRTSNNSIIDTIAVGEQPFTIANDNSHVYVANAWGNNISVIGFSGVEPDINVLIEDLIGRVDSLVDAGILNRGQGRSLIAKLENAQRKFNQGKIKTAINILNAFINHVNSFIDEGVLTVQQGQALIDAAQFIIHILESEEGKAAGGTMSDRTSPENEFHEFMVLPLANDPNRFLIKYQLPKKHNVDIAVYNLLGQKIQTLVDEEMEAGLHKIIWDGRDNLGEMVPNSVYFIKFDTDQYRATRKLLLLR